MDIKEILVEGSTKKVYATNQNDQVLITYYDKAAGGSKKKTASGGIVNFRNAVCGFLFEYLESYNIPTHYIRKHDESSFLARRMEMLPITVVIYNIGSGDLSKRFGLKTGQLLEFPIVELYYKGGKSAAMINEYHAYALGLCDRKEMTSLMRIATKVNAVLKSFFERKKIKLGSFRMEFGRMHHQIFLADEIQLDSENLWAVKPDGSLSRIPETPSKDGQDFQSVLSEIVGFTA